MGTGENQSQRSVGFGDGVYKSADAGRTWSNVGLGRSEHIAKILVDPRHSNVVRVAAQGPLWAPGGDRGLYKTTDGGKRGEPRSEKTSEGQPRQVPGALVAPGRFAVTLAKKIGDVLTPIGEQTFEVVALR